MSILEQTSVCSWRFTSLSCSVETMRICLKVKDLLKLRICRFALTNLSLSEERRGVTNSFIDFIFLRLSKGHELFSVAQSVIVAADHEVAYRNCYL